MSYQHFYSRVPARVSLYNKRDGFDTFAHSAALDRQFILGELSSVYAGLLDIHSPLKLRRGEIPNVYSQALLPSGRLVHTAVNYLPTDFTGERSAYLAHSLILTEDEIDRVVRNHNADVFNRDMFITDISVFRLTDRNVMANSACPERAYAPRPILDHGQAISAFNPEMLKSFIHSILLAILEGGREVYFRLPFPDSSVSEASLDFINGIMSVLPYSLRERLSFVSYVSDSRSYPGFKLKGVGASFEGVSPDRGVFYDFSTGIVTGQPDQAERGVMISSFLYSLFEHNNIRETFHHFVERIEGEYNSLVVDIKMLKELTFLFWQCSGFYVEDSVLPGDDAICRLFDIYESYRNGVTVEHRVQLYKCLTRYSQAQIAIPDSVFSRLSRLYPGDCVEAKAVALEVLLDLIHVDLMRDSLFCFISRNYPSETEGVRAEIISNLSRVFYGGFLQNNILAFFDLYFRREPVNNRDVILDKLLLSIRTPEVQMQIVNFLDRHYAALNSAQKLKICNICLEMIPECDGLSALLVGLIDRRIGREGSDISTLMNSKLAELLAGSLAAGDVRLANIFIENPGFCQDILLRHALNQWVGTELILGILAAMPLTGRADRLIRAYALAESGNRSLYPALIYRFASIAVMVWPSTLKEILERDGMAEQSIPADMIDLFRQIVIYPAVVYTLHQAFSTDEGAVGVDLAVAYAEKNPYIASTGEYRVITDYLSLVHKCGLGDTEGAFKIALSFPESQELRAAIGGYIRAKNYHPDTQDAETMATYELIVDYLTTGNLGFGTVYNRYVKYFEDIRIEEGKMGVKSAMRRASSDAIELIISCASEICDADDRLAEIAMKDASGLNGAISEFIAFYGPGAGAFLKKQTKDAFFEIEELVEELIDERNDNINTPIDAVNFLLRRK